VSRAAFIQNKLGKTDGVSLEVDKWRRVLEGMGHEVLYCAGNDDVAGIHCIPELSLFHPTTRRILRNGTVELTDYDAPADLLADIHAHAETIERKLRAFIDQQKVDILIPNNLQSVGYNIPAMPALYNVIRDTGLATIAHSHDFWFEDSGEVNATCPEVAELFERYAPPDLPNVRHVVINRIAQRLLAERKGIEARVVPNVFDFDQPAWRPDAYNADFRERIGLSDGDVMLLQATRILDRKGVELAIDLVGELDTPDRRRQLAQRGLYDGRGFDESSRIVLVCSGYVESFGISGDYHANLLSRAADRGVDIRFVGEIVQHSRGRADDGSKVYSLWDSYVSADLVTYPSWWEGWGNQFIEAVFARKPVCLFEYPVYVSDLKEAGFDVISLGDALGERDHRGLVTVPPQRLAEAADQAVEMLTHADRRRRAVESNARIAEQRYSYRVLEGIIRELMDELEERT
jgi:glycosyltransferase involved in cell wall biosynthesis